MIEVRARELLRREEVEERFGVSRSWIYCEMRAGRFPEPVRIGMRAVRWRVSDLDVVGRRQAGGARRAGSLVSAADRVRCRMCSSRPRPGRCGQ